MEKEFKGGIKGFEEKYSSLPTELDRYRFIRDSIDTPKVVITGEFELTEKMKREADEFFEELSKQGENKE